MVVAFPLCRGVIKYFVKSVTPLSLVLGGIRTHNLLIFGPVGNETGLNRLERNEWHPGAATEWLPRPFRHPPPINTTSEVHYNPCRVFYQSSLQRVHSPPVLSYLTRTSVERIRQLLLWNDVLGHSVRHLLMSVAGTLMHFAEPN